MNEIHPASGRDRRQQGLQSSSPNSDSGLIKGESKSNFLNFKKKYRRVIPKVLQLPIDSLKRHLCLGLIRTIMLLSESEPVNGNAMSVGMPPEKVTF